jgi:putative sigma-54 modulation protein
MEVIVQGRNLRVNDALEHYARKKVDRLDRYLPNIYEVRVDLSHENSRRGNNHMAIAQITVRHSRGAILRTEERVIGDIQTAINQAVDKMYRQIQRFKGRRSRKGRERFTATIEELNLAEPIPDVADYEEVIPAEEAVEAQSAIARRKEVTLVAMNETEAVEQMELLGHSFFMFFNGDTGAINVLYKRAAGDYGLLVPKIE